MRGEGRLGRYQDPLDKGVGELGTRAGFDVLVGF
jgi:hypothetical protein